MKNAIEAIDPHEIDVIYVKQREGRFIEYWNQYNDLSHNLRIFGHNSRYNKCGETQG